MIGLLRGKVLDAGSEVLLVDTNGVGYEVAVSAAVLSELSAVETQGIRVFTDVKENSISLYGFKDKFEREVFLLLKKVKGVGSKTALSIISGLGPTAVLNSIGMNDVSGFKSISGIGSKTAERIILELKTNVAELLKTQSLNGQVEVANVRGGNRTLPPGAQGSTAVSDVVLALEKLGIAVDSAWAVVKSALENNKEKYPDLAQQSGDLLRLSLASLSKF